jgi:hypothetical protein
MIQWLLAKGAPLEIENVYGGTVLGQALWSAFKEPREQYPLIIQMLIKAGAKIPPGSEAYIRELS